MERRYRYALIGTISAAVVAGAIVGLQIARTPGREAGGPLDESSDSGSICVYAPPKASVSFGAAIFANPDSSPALIQSVTVNQLHNVHLVGPPQMVPQTGNTAVGVDNHYPPVLSRLPGVDWSARTNAAGSSVPGRGSIKTDQNVFDLVVGVKRNGLTDGSFSGVTINYRIGRKKYVMNTRIGVIVYRKPCGDDSPSTVPYPPE